MLREEHELLPRRGRRSPDLAVSRGGGRLPGPARLANRREDLAEQARELAPLGIRAAAAHAKREVLERLQGFDLRLQLHDGAGRGRLVENARLGIFRLLFRRVVELRDVVRVELRSRERNGGGVLAAALEHFELAQAALQPLATPAQRLVDRLGRRGEPPLEKRQRKADRARPAWRWRVPRRG